MKNYKIAVADTGYRGHRVMTLKDNTLIVRCP